MKKIRLIAASSSDSADILYAGGFNAHDPFIYFSSGREKGIIVTTLEFGRAVNECKKGIKVHNRDELFRKDDNNRDIVFQILRLAEKFNASEIEVPYTFPLGYADFLRSHGLKVSCVKGEFFPERECKKTSEITRIREAMRAAEKGMSRAVSILKEAGISSKKQLKWKGGILSSEILRSEIEIEMLRYGGTASSTIAACGSASAEPHNTGRGPIYANKPIVVDIFPRMNAHGYWGDITRTFVKGKAPDIVKKAFDAVREARDKSKNAITPGVKASDVYKIAYSILEKRGFPTGRKNGVYYGFIHSLGHSLGLEIHESPRLSPINEMPLKKGNVLTVEPGVYYPEWGGIRLEDLVLVKESFSECITQFETFLEIG
ncbi:MAG: hypothetical protein A2017_05145 [Lentisphaerae bacterium GWF2_44_16]|nr:MAG: hypothetical protein A2017_05145 [Lentisphaerae bacterium GWF2_44_16]